MTRDIFFKITLRKQLCKLNDNAYTVYAANPSKNRIIRRQFFFFKCGSEADINTHLSIEHIESVEQVDRPTGYQPIIITIT